MFESQFIDDKDLFIAATDEVGRGPLAGPVVAACVTVSGNLEGLCTLISYLEKLGITDSKKLNHKKRRRILNDLNINFENKLFWKFKIEQCQIKIAVDEKSRDYIDEHNILQSSLVAMRDAFLKTLENSFKGSARGVVLIDGNKNFAPVDKNIRLLPVVKGDTKATLIGLASIVAKVYRDELMGHIAKKYPHYGFEKNSGYPTQMHRDAIKQHGITPFHRLSFKGVKEFVLP